MDVQSQQVNPKKLFIGNLSYQTQEETISEAFSQFGEIVSVKLITDRNTGRSKGIAFLEYGTEEAAQAAISAMNNQELDGRSIIVSVARPMQPRDNNRGGYGGPRRDDRGGYGGGRGGHRSY